MEGAERKTLNYRGWGAFDRDAGVLASAPATCKLWLLGALSGLAMRGCLKRRRPNALSGRALAQRGAVLLLTAGLASVAAPALADATVYRCTVDGQVLYTDHPCTGAERLDVKSGAAAPDARERLQRDQDALDRRAAERRAAQARETALQRMLDERARSAAVPPDYAPPDTAYPAYAYGAPWPVVEPRRLRAREPERRRLRSVVPVPPPVPERLRR
jgi:hypothetical protein